MVGLLQNIFLKQGRLDLVVVQDNVLAERFHGVDLAVLHLLDQEHLTKASTTDHAPNLKVVQHHLGLVFIFHKQGVGAHLCKFLVEARNVSILVAEAAMGDGRAGLLLLSGFLFVDVLGLEAEVLLGVDLDAVADVLLGSVVLLELIGHAVDRQVDPVGFIVDEFYRLENLVPEVALVHVVVLALHVDDELTVVAVGALGHCFDRAHCDPSLHLVFLNVVEVLVGQQQAPVLLHAPAVELDDLAGEDDLLALVRLQLGLDLPVLLALLEVGEFLPLLHSMSFY